MFFLLITRLSIRLELLVCGIGSIWFCIHDGVVKYVLNVRHIPTSLLNLISLGQLDRCGCTLVARGGVLKVRTVIALG